MTLSQQQLDSYDERGFLVIEGFADDSSCDLLRARAEQLVKEFDPAEVVSIFSTREQNRVADDYFLTSGDKIRFFFEENAFLPNGTLKYEKEKSINKIAHALLDLYLVIDCLSSIKKVKQFSASLILDESLLVQSMYIFK